MSYLDEFDDFYGGEQAPLPDGVIPEDSVEEVLAAYERGVKGVTADPDEDGITCDCCPEHPVTRQPVPNNPKGWKGKLPVALDGSNWPVDFAAKILGCSEKDLRDLIRIVGLEPVGTLKMASYRRSGRHPRAYDGSKLVKLWQAIQDLTRDINK